MRFSSFSFSSSFSSGLLPKFVRRAVGGVGLLLLGLLYSTFNQSAVASAAYVQTSFPEGFVSEVVIGSGLRLPTAMAFAAENRIFVAEKRGVVRVWQNGALLPTPFIDLQDEVHDYGDRGLLGLAIHPNFPATPYLYLLYSYDPPGVAKDTSGARVSRLLRVTADAANPNVAAAASAETRVVLLGTNSTLANIGNPENMNDSENVACGRAPNYVRDCVPADYDTHSIGTVTFGADGMLYVGNGDASSFTYSDVRALRALDVDSMAGKIFRIDPLTGQGLSDNPFYNGDPDANRSKVLNLGLRNPFRFTVNPQNNQVFIGDVGMDAWEEINTGTGKNFGWPCYEGNHLGSAQQGQYANDGGTMARCRQLYAEGESAVQAPLYAYNHGGAGGASANAGAVYTASNYPEQYHGALFIADYNRDWIKYLTFDEAGRATVHDFGEDVGGLGGPAQIVLGPDGNLYYIALGWSSEVRRIRYVNAVNQPPIVNVNAAVTSGGAPLTVQFSSAGSYDPDAQALRYTWEFGNGATSEQANPTYIYTTAGNFTARLTVTDEQGATASAELEIIVGNNRPTLTINSPANGVRYETGTAINFSGTATDTEDGALSANIQWKALLHHNEHVHFHFFTFTGAQGTFVVPDHGDNTYYELCASVADSQGAAATTRCVELRPNTVQYTFTSVPSGLVLNYAGASYTTPFTVTTIPNSTREISAAATQNGLNFQGWSDGGARAHSFTVGVANQMLTANYLSNSQSNIADVVWTSLANTTTQGRTLRKNSGANDGTFDGRARSQQVLSGNGYLEFTVSGPANERIIGFAAEGTDPATLPLAFFLNESGYAEFREQGIYLGDTSFTNGDVLRLQLVDGQAQYFKNGVLQFSGALRVTGRLQAIASFNLPGSEISNAQIAIDGANACQISLSATNQTFPANGGTGTLQIAANAGCAWTAVSKANWLTLTSSASGTGNGTLSYRVAANTGQQRAATLEINGQTFVVIQQLYVSGGNGNSDNLTWVDTNNVTLTGSDVSKTGGANDGRWDGRASSQEALSGNGYLEFTVSGPQVYRACGLTDATALGDPSTLAFAAVLTGSDIVEFRERGVYVGDARVVSGDVIRISINDGRASYFKNGVLLFAGTAATNQPLRVAALFSYLNGVLSNVRLSAQSSTQP